MDAVGTLLERYRGEREQREEIIDELLGSEDARIVEPLLDVIADPQESSSVRVGALTWFRENEVPADAREVVVSTLVGVLGDLDDHLVVRQTVALALEGLLDASVALDMVGARLLARDDDLFLRRSLLAVVEAIGPSTETNSLLTSLAHDEDLGESVHRILGAWGRAQPDREEPAQLARQTRVIVRLHISADGAILLDGEPAGAESIRQVLTAAREQGGEAWLHDATRGRALGSLEALQDLLAEVDVSCVQYAEDFEEYARVRIDRIGRVFVDGEETALAQLDDRLAATGKTKAWLGCLDVEFDAGVNARAEVEALLRRRFSELIYTLAADCE